MADERPLLEAIQAGDAVRVEALLDAGAAGSTAEALALERDHAEVVPLLRGTAP